MERINYKNSEECLPLRYKDMLDMQIEDAIFILNEVVSKYHNAKSDKHRINLPRLRMIRAYEIAIDCMKNNINDNWITGMRIVLNHASLALL